MIVSLLLALPLQADAARVEPPPLAPADVFDLEYAADPRLSPDGEHVAYVRTFHDVLTDRRRSHVWIVSADGKDHRPLVTGPADAASPRWSPDGSRLLYSSTAEGSSQLFVRWMDTGVTARLAQLGRPPSGLSWSPDGSRIAFSMLVPEPEESFVEMPPRPEGAEWAEAPRVIRRLNYRSDGEGYLENGHRQLFVLPAEGGTPRQVTEGPHDHEGTPSWTPDGRALVFSANRRADADLEPLDSELYAVDLEDGTLSPLTDRRGPDHSPAVSPDGRHVAYTGFDDRVQGYQVTRLYVLERSSGDVRCLTEALDRDVAAPAWDDDGEGLTFLYDDRGTTHVGRIGLDGTFTALAGDVGGTTLGRPYGSGSHTAAVRRVAFTLGSPQRPADVALLDRESGDVRRLTALNEDLLAHRTLGAVEELEAVSSHDGRPVHAWLVLPPGFDAERRYPLVLEIHGGPFANYGPRFSAECQLYAAAGNVVLYVNPRGSTSYGEEFGNLIHHAYPGFDYDDLMSAVDAVLERGFVDPGRLYVTGGSGGGVLSAWIVGKTDRFRAAVVAKPVIHWTSFALTADAYGFFYRYWFPGPPWEHHEHYWRRSPLSLVGNVTTPTMVLTGEQDHRTPITESEQLYQALKLRGVETALVRVPGASHSIAARPSHLIAKVLHVLRWFELHAPESAE